MTIDEAIKKYKEKSKFFKKTTNVSYALELEQLVEWLEELKEYKEHEFDILKKDGQLLYKQGILDGYNKAIDDFVSRLETVSFTKTQWDLIKTIAEQLKAGEQNE